MKQTFTSAIITIIAVLGIHTITHADTAKGYRYVYCKGHQESKHVCCTNPTDKNKRTIWMEPRKNEPLSSACKRIHKKSEVSNKCNKQTYLHAIHFRIEQICKQPVYCMAAKNNRFTKCR